MTATGSKRRMAWRCGGMWKQLARAGQERGRRARSFWRVGAAAGGFVCGSALLAAQQLQLTHSECAASERRADFVVLGGGTSAMGGGSVLANLSV